MPNREQIDFILKGIGLDLTEEQAPIIYCPNREILVAGGERAGKSRVSSAFLSTRIPYGKLSWMVAADYERNRGEFDDVCEDLTKLGIGFEASKRIDPGEIIVEGGIHIVTKSAKDPRQLAVKPPDGILINEASQVDYETYLRCRGRVMEKRGWLLMSGTFESSLGWYPEMFGRGQTKSEDELVSFSLPTWSNVKIFPGGRQDPEILRIERMSSRDWFLERYGGVPCPPKGRVFEEFSMKLHVGTGDLYDLDPAQPVYLWVDPGYAAAYAVLVVQIRGDEVFIVDEIFESKFVTEDIVKIAASRPWWKQVIGGAIDIAATQHQATIPVAEIWMNEGKRLGCPILLQSQKVGIRDGIERTKTYLLVNPATGKTKLHINAKCKGLISELGGCPNPLTNQSAVYSWKIDREGRVVGDVPDDKNNHATKALSYGLVNKFGYSTYQKRDKVKFF
jgi:hypothetical protein